MLLLLLFWESVFEFPFDNDVGLKLIWGKEDDCGELACKFYENCWYCKGVNVKSFCWACGILGVDRQSRRPLLKLTDL